MDVVFIDKEITMKPGRPKKILALSAEERAQLESIASSRSPVACWRPAPVPRDRCPMD